MYLVSNPGWTEEDCEASLAFRGMEDELRIFDRTQGVVARYGDPLQIFFHVGTHFQDMLASRRLVEESLARCFGIGYLERRYGKNVWKCLDSVVIARRCPNNKLEDANKNLVNYDDEIEDMIPCNLVSHGITKTGHMRVRHLKPLASMSHPPSLHTQAPRAGHNKEPPQGSNTWIHFGEQHL
nr:hypothetical protein TIFTF001_048713 [Ficus carica]